MTANPPVLLLWGEDGFLLREAALEELGDVRPQEVDAREWQGGETTDLSTPSLFGEPRALLVTGPRHLSEPALKELAAYLSAPSPDARLILAAEVSERSRAPAALTKLVKGIGEVREVNVSRRDLQRWVLERARRKGLRLASDAAAELVGRVGESPAALDGAVDQLVAAFPQARVGAGEVRSQFRGLGEQRIWDLCDRMFGRDLPGSVRSLRSLLESREDPLFILGGLASRLRDLLRVKALPERIPPAELAQRTGLRFDWQARRYREQAARFSMEELIELHRRVADADRDIKSGASGEVVLPVLVASAAGG